MSVLTQMLRDARAVAVFSGAGVSTLCGIPDFRGPQGLYKQPDAERMFDIDWFDRDPSIYYAGAADLVYGLNAFQPGPVHHAVALLERRGIVRGVVTQNIDMLHQRAGSTVVHEVHGSPMVHRCWRCGLTKSFDEICAMIQAAGRANGDVPAAASGGAPRSDPGPTPSRASVPAPGRVQPRAGRAFVPRCERCGGPFKPDITFFGEALPQAAFESAVALARESDLMLVLGSSLTVYPAASIPELTLRAGGRLVIVNAQPTSLDPYAALRLDDLAAFAAEILESFA